MNPLRMSILSSLAAGPRHGYAILLDINDVSGGRLSPPVGSLYRIIDALSRDGLIEADRVEVVDGRERRYYQLTQHGRYALADAITTVDLVATRAQARLNENPHTSQIGRACP